MKMNNTRASASLKEMIHVAHVDKFYGDFQALSDVDLSVNQGERIVICGPSGSGKSS
jgi:polar amino acid transport system ATP-binding protein